MCVCYSGSFKTLNVRPCCGNVCTGAIDEMEEYVGCVVNLAIVNK